MALVPGPIAQRISKAARAARLAQTGGLSTPGVGGGGSPANPGITIPGRTPDYRQLALADPAFSSFQSGAMAAGVSDATSRQRAIRDLLIRAGQIPTTFTDPYGDVNDETRQLAADNPHSFRRQQEQEFTDQNSAMRRALAARGLLGSGQEAFEASRLARGRSQAEYNFNTELLRGLGEAQDAFARGEYERSLQTSSALADAIARQAELHPVTGAQQAVLAPDMQGPNGEAVYKGSDGTFYDVNGKPIQAKPRLSTGNLPESGGPRVMAGTRDVILGPWPYDQKPNSGSGTNRIQ